MKISNAFFTLTAVACLALNAQYTFAQATTSTATSVTAAEAAGEHGHTYGGSGEATIVSSVSSAQPLAVGKTSEMILSLKTKDGKPVPLSELEVVHMEPIHLLIVDPSLSDYHHIHPKAAADPGTYAFSFTPKKGGTYNVYSDLHPKPDMIQEYSFSTIEVPGAPAGQVEKADNREFTADGYTFKLAFDDPNLVQGKATGATVMVAGADGQPFNKLEPVMGAFAHMVGFSQDRQNVAHIHPLGKEPETTEERGGPELKFHVGLPQPGYHVLYVQVQINGKDVFAPFGVEVAPRPMPTDAKAAMLEVDESLEKLENVANFGPMHKVHELAFNVRDLLMELPKIVPSLEADKKAKLDMSLKRIGSFAGLLDKYGDAKNAEQTQALFPRFKAEVAAIHELVGTTPKGGADAVDAKILGNTKCPVSGMPVGSMEAGAALVYNGVKVGLCCNGCTETFMKDPEAGLKKAQESVKQ